VESAGLPDDILAYQKSQLWDSLKAFGVKSFGVFHPFGIFCGMFCGRLEYFHFGTAYQGKSGNPGRVKMKGL
jgi:hypothetical protein